MFMFLPWHHINIICSYFWCKQKGRKIVFSMSPPDSWYRSEAISPGVNMATMKSNLKEHTPLIHTEEKLFTASFVAKLPVQSSI